MTANGRIDCLLFLWTVTGGGGGPDVRPANERRIQMTGVAGIPLRPGLRTLLGGWSEEFGVYCFWDPRRHSRSRSRSPSLQVTAGTLDTASRVGIATYLRPAEMGQEVVVAVSPSSLLWYVERGLELHNAEEDALSAVEMAEASPEEQRNFIDEGPTPSQQARRYDLVETMRAFREAGFRPAVLQAYAYRCTVCRCALKLVDAAHIVPVSFPESSDEVTNGLALCRLHHGAYDNGLLGIRSDYSIVTNDAVEQRLAALGLDSGLEDFRQRLPSQITPPASIEARPLPAYLLLGMRARRWPDSLIA
ncbi:MAG TPA: HNH endonuclease [Pirellulales bacterium]|nr:HNH endonuclease [Pirellulales bacterium]